MYKLIDQTDEFVLICKNEGVDFHKGSALVGLVQTVRHDLKLTEMYPLHRLDTMTSGLLLFAKKKSSAQKLALQFRDHSISKFYLALSDCQPKKKQGLIIGDMNRGRRGAWLLSKSKVNPSVTQFYSAGLGNGLRLFILHPCTGRTHQLRVALKAISAPILGDTLYHNKTNEIIVADRGYLHAFALGFTLDGKLYRYVNLPETGRYFTDENFCTVIEKFKDPWSIKWPEVKRRRIEN